MLSKFIKQQNRFNKFQTENLTCRKLDLCFQTENLNFKQKSWLVCDIFNKFQTEILYSKYSKQKNLYGRVGFTKRCVQLDVSNKLNVYSRICIAFIPQAHIEKVTKKSTLAEQFLNKRKIMGNWLQQLITKHKSVYTIKFRFMTDIQQKSWTPICVHVRLFLLFIANLGQFQVHLITIASKSL